MTNCVLMFLVSVSFAVTLFRNRPSSEITGNLICSCETGASECAVSTSKMQELHIWNNNHTRKWKNQNEVENQAVVTIQSKTIHPWIVKKELGGSEECQKWQGLWNIYLLKNDENDLFASYKSFSDHLTLQSKGTNQQSFVLHIAPNGMFLIKSNEKKRNRFLKQVGEYVKMVELNSTENLDQSFEWDIAHPALKGEILNLRTSCTRISIVELSDSINNQWGHNVLTGDSIPVQTYAASHQQCWKATSTRMIGQNVTLTFEKYCPNDNATSEVVGWNSSHVVLSPSNTNDERRFFGVYNRAGITLQKVLSSSESNYLGISGGHLTWTSKCTAKIWSQVTAPKENFISDEPLQPAKDL